MRKNGNRDLFRDHKERAVHFQRMCETKSGWPVGIAKPTWVSIPFDLKKTMNEFLPANTVPEFHYFQRFCFDWHLVFYCHNEDAMFSSQHEGAFTHREGQARDFMNRLQRRLSLRENEMVFFATTEFGKTGGGHLHILISLDGLRKKGHLEKLVFCAASFPQATEMIRKGMFPKSLKIDCQPITPDIESQNRLLSYVCKKERGQNYKHCFFSKKLMV